MKGSAPFQRSGREGWYLRWRYAGNRSITRRVADTKTKAAAVRIAVQVAVEGGMPLIEAIDMHAPRKAVVGSAPTWATIADLYLKNFDRVRGRKSSTKAETRKRVEYIIKRLQKEAWASIPIPQLRSVDVIRWVDTRRAGGASDSTIANDVSTASSIFKTAMHSRQGWIPRGTPNPFLDCREGVEKKRKASFSVDEFREFFQIAESMLHPSDFAILRALGVSGWRLGDVAGLTAAKVDLDYPIGEMRVVRAVVERGQEKTRQRKATFFVGDTAEWITRRIRDGKLIAKGIVFQPPRAHTYERGRLLNQRIRKVMAKMDSLPRWKIEGDDAHCGITVHSLRHSANNAMRLAGISAFTRSAQLGHRPPAGMTYHYSNAEDAELYRVAEVMEATLFGSGDQSGDRSESESA